MAFRTFADQGRGPRGQTRVEATVFFILPSSVCFPNSSDNVSQTNLRSSFIFSSQLFNKIVSKPLVRAHVVPRHKVASFARLPAYESFFSQLIFLFIAIMTTFVQGDVIHYVGVSLECLPLARPLRHGHQAPVADNSQEHIVNSRYISVDLFPVLQTSNFFYHPPSGCHEGWLGHLGFSIFLTCNIFFTLPCLILNCCQIKVIFDCKVAQPSPASKCRTAPGQLM